MMHNEFEFTKIEGKYDVIKGFEYFYSNSKNLLNINLRNLDKSTTILGGF